MFKKQGRTNEFLLPGVLPLVRRYLLTHCNASAFLALGSFGQRIELATLLGA
jgi:hypothetical protein